MHSCSKRTVKRRELEPKLKIFIFKRKKFGNNYKSKGKSVGNESFKDTGL